MGKRGPKPKNKIKIKWSSDFAYAVGLIATDGCLNKRNGHIDFTSKELEQILNFKRCLNLDSKIGKKFSGTSHLSYRVQFQDMFFYDFLLQIGLTTAKSKSLERLNIPIKYFFDFLRGVFDGDGTSYSYWDPRWKSSFMFYISFASASKNFILWLREMINNEIGVNGHLTKSMKSSCFQLKYAKSDSYKILKKMYYSESTSCLKRKRLKIEKTLAIIGKSL